MLEYRLHLNYVKCVNTFLLFNLNILLNYMQNTKLFN